MTGKYDIIITTYNRPDSCKKLIDQILKSTIHFENLFVVDSSDEKFRYSDSESRVRIISSSLKSQPYQRKLGAEISDAEIILFLDDDLEILKPFEPDLMFAFESKSISGVSFGMQMEYGINQKINTWKWSNYLNLGISKFIKKGKIWYCGLTGGLQDQPGLTSFFYGGVMAFRRVELLEAISDDILYLSLEKLLMGEDKVISMKINSYGLLFYYSGAYFKHPLNESSYFQNLYQYFRMMVYSRFFLSLIYAKERKKFILNPYLIYYIYWIFGFMKVIFYSLLGVQGFKERIKGWVKGLILTINPALAKNLEEKYSDIVSRSLEIDRIGVQ